MFLFDFTLTNEEDTTLLLVNHKIVLFAQVLKYGKRSFKLFLLLNENEIIGVPSVPYLRVSDSPFPFTEKILEVDVKESRTQGGTLVYPFLDSDKLITSLEVRVLVEPLEEQDFSIVIDVQIPENLEQSIFFDCVVCALEVDKDAEHLLPSLDGSELLEQLLDIHLAAAVLHESNLISVHLLGKVSIEFPQESQFQEFKERVLYFYWSKLILLGDIWPDFIEWDEFNFESVPHLGKKSFIPEILEEFLLFG